MRDYNFLKSKFSEKHTIDNVEYLEKYIKLILEYRLCESDEYTERHHILPKSVFPEFENENWNIIELKYEDHINAHLFLFKSINIRQYQRPLNWMLNTYKNKEEISNAAKIGWVNLKMDSDKYSEWCRKRSDFMKKIPIEEQRRRANIFWDNISDEQYLKFSQKMKDHWTDDKRMEKSKQMNVHYSNPDNIIKKSIEGRKRWNSMTEEERKKFNDKMNTINKDESKRKDAGFKIKNLWKDERYLEKMKNRKSNPGKSIKIIKPDGQEIIIDNMKKMENDYSISSHLIRKYRDKDIYIEDKDLKDNKLLLNCKIQSI